MLKIFLKKLSIVVLELAVIAGGLYYLAQKKSIHKFNQIIPAFEEMIQDSNQEKQQPFPSLSQPVDKTFNWEYKGKKYSLDETLYQSAYDYYKSQPKQYSYAESLPANWEDEYYLMFLKSAEGDNTISDLAKKIQDLGKKHNLTDNQIVDLTLGFVQSIPYDDAKAKDILAKKGNIAMRFPYEVLWEQTGVCSDKSLLAYALLKEIGYGVALFAFEQDNHMAVAVQCPQNYSNYASGYCYAETTSTGNKIGVVPDFDTEKNKTVSTEQIPAYNPDQIQPKTQKLGPEKIILATQGKQYSGIIQTKNIADQISRLKNDMATLLPEMQSQKNTIDQEWKKLENTKDDADKYKKEGDIDEYNSLAKKYNSLLETYKQDVKKYNNNVILYNRDVKKYNALIKQ